MSGPIWRRRALGGLRQIQVLSVPLRKHNLSYADREERAVCLLLLLPLFSPLIPTFQSHKLTFTSPEPCHALSQGNPTYISWTLLFQAIKMQEIVRLMPWL